MKAIVNERLSPNGCDHFLVIEGAVTTLVAVEPDGEVRAKVLPVSERADLRRHMTLGPNRRHYYMIEG